MPKDTEKVEDKQDVGRPDPPQFGTGTPMPNLNPNAPKIPGPYDAPPRKTPSRKRGDS